MEYIFLACSENEADLLHNTDMDNIELNAISEATKTEILTQISGELAGGLNEGVCAVCDTLTVQSNLNRISIDDDLLRVMTERLVNPDSTLNPSLLQFYNCSDLHPQLEGMMLSRLGVTVAAPGVVYVDLCDECKTSLKRPSAMSLPPKFAIANHFFIGRLPDDLFCATWPEFLMCTLVSVVAQTRVLRGGVHRAIRSHLVLFDAVPGPPVTLLPRKLNRDALYRIVLAGPFTDEQIKRVRQLHAVRHAMVSSLMDFYRRNNHWYAHISVDTELIDSLPVDTTDYVPDGIIEMATELEREADQVDQQQASINRHSGDLSTASAADEER